MRILITAGPTREFFDSVRFISNPSTGKMGYRLAEIAHRRGHEVVLISGPVALTPPAGVRCIQVISAEEMASEAKQVFPGCSTAIMTAAVCDYRPEVRLPHKLQKSDQPRHIVLQATEDICAWCGHNKGDRVVIGFAMEDHDHQAHAEAKLRRKNCDAIVLNGPENVGSDSATVRIFTADGQWSDAIAGTKAEVAERIIVLAESLNVQ